MESNLATTLAGRLEDLDTAERLVQHAWDHLSQQFDDSIAAGQESDRLAIARTLLVEAVEAWGAAIGALLRLCRAEPQLASMVEPLETALQYASRYLANPALAGEPAPFVAERAVRD